MIRTHVYLTDLQAKRLEELSKSSGLKKSDIVRRAIDRHFHELDMDSDRIRRLKRGKRQCR